MNDELVSVKSRAHGGDGNHYIVTTGGGRKKVAHIPSGVDGERTVCNKAKDGNVRRVDSVTAEKFYSICKTCRRKKK